MAIYNTTFMNNATSILDLISGSGEAIGQNYLFGNLILFSFLLIYVVTLALRFNFAEVVITGSFITGIIAILMFYINIVNVTAIIVPFVLLCIALIYYLIWNNG